MNQQKRQDLGSEHERITSPAAWTRRVLLLALLTGMLASETLKYVLFPHIAMWVSDTITLLICGAAVLATAGGIAGRQAELNGALTKEMERRSLAEANVHDAHDKLMCIRVELEETVLQRTEELRVAEEKYRSIFENAIEGIFQTTPDGHYISANPALARIYGYGSPAELIADLRDIGCQLYVDPTARETFREELESADTVQGFEAEVYRCDGRRIWISENARAVRDDTGCVICYEGTVEDISDRRRAETDIRSLYRNLANANAEMRQAYEETIEGWSRALDLRDKETQGHSTRVTDMTVRLAEAMGVEEDKLVHMRRGALLHDIGKMGVPDQILLKPARLTNEEMALMRMHPLFALDMIEPIEFLRPALDIPYSHHEKWDGTGYPLGLHGDDIPLAARIFAVVDVWDALLSDRPYRESWPDDRVYAYIAEESGKHFDPQVVETFLSITGRHEVNPPLAIAA